MKNYLIALFIFVGISSLSQLVWASDEDSEESISKIKNEMSEKVGIETTRLSPRRLNQEISVYGKTTIGVEQLFQINARYNGVIKTINYTIGDKVKKGDLLAVIESNESLNTYEVRSPVSGLVIQRNGNVGATTQQRILFEIANVDTLWAEFRVFATHFIKVEVGQEIEIEFNGEVITSTVTNIIPTKDQPFVFVRALLDNTKYNLSSGQLLKGYITTNQFDVDLAIEKLALQELGGQLGVFVKEGEEYEFTPLILGRSDKNHIEVIDGLVQGSEYVSKNSFLIKADILKSEVEDDD
ncbi:cobalt-zinc-cadmium resistance protein CzcB [Pseudoalteromonas ulvae UL12]|uniref:efflux RND transporter periplasmic adaptor subunit n=1 Tax=Pseudoalteromonas ulvae TaxID=107327 RepID=UPI00186BACB4|nr:efflux RND transporter periplasmic adaptor subunit [Pseudoalteromonas ulvae]MBE0365324.1 cobalt-zinc-cadmium resistance protein CzcB [Pseudoalteromonas ulvae UL12]